MTNQDKAEKILKNLIEDMKERPSISRLFCISPREQMDELMDLWKNIILSVLEGK